MDSSGESLHKRGYKKYNSAAPLNEVLAAGIVLMSKWDKKTNLLDPMCGTGTFLIEAAMIAKNIAPNLNRLSFAFEKWKETTKSERLELLEKLLGIYKSRWDEMTDAISTELGCPKDWCSANQTSSGSGHIEDFIKRLKNFEFEPGFDKGSVNHIVYEPIGVCGLITPWNWPINQIALKVIPALATGCTMVLKPSEIAPLSGMLFAEMINEAGFPKGVFNLVNGDGVGVGTDLSGHPDVDLSLIHI